MNLQSVAAGTHYVSLCLEEKDLLASGFDADPHCASSSRLLRPSERKNSEHKSSMHAFILFYRQ